MVRSLVMTASTGRGVGEVSHTNGWILSPFNQQQMEPKYRPSFLPRSLCQNTLPALVVLVEGLIVIEECVLYVRIEG